MGKYLKMADVFNGDVNVSNVYGFILYTGSIYDYSTICEHAAAFDNESAVYISNAINSHDELVAEVERLRKSLKWAVENLPFENAFEWSDDENADAHYAALGLLGVDTDE